MLKSLVKDVAIYGGADFLFRFTQLLAVPIYAHLLSVADFGILSLLIVSAALLGMIAGLGVNNSVQRFYFDPELPEHERPSLISTGLLQLTITAGLATLVGFVLATMLRDELANSLGISWTLALVALAIVLPEQLSQYLLDSVRLHFAPLKFCLIALVKNFGAVLLGLLFLIQFDMGVLGLLLGQALAAMLAVPVGLLMVRRDLTLRVDRAVAAKVFRYGYPFVFAAAAYWVFGSMGNWMLGALSSIEQVGLFAIGLKFAAVMTFIISAFAQAWSPFALRMYGQDPDYLANWSRIFSGWFFLLALAGFTLALFAPEMMRILTPEPYWPAADILAIGSVGLVLYGTVQMTVLGISIAKRTVLITYAAWMAAGTAVLLDLILIPPLGAVGAAIAALAAYAVLTSTMLYWTQRLHPMPLEYRKLGYGVAVVAASLGWTGLVGTAQVGPELFMLKIVMILLAVGGAFLVGILDRRLYRLLLRRRAAA